MTKSAVIGGGAGNGTNGTYNTPSVTTTATYTGKSNGTGTVVLAQGMAAGLESSVERVVAGVLMLLGVMAAL